MSDRIAMRPLLSRACLVALAGVWAAVAPVRSQTQGPEIPKGTNVLFGRVLDAGTEAPVAGAVVMLTGYFDPSGRPSATIPSPPAPGASARRSVMTNGDGYFFFRELPAGRYSLAAVAFGYINNTYPLHVVDLAEGDKPAAAPVHLWKYAAISGSVFDDRGEPIAGVPVTALRRTTMGGSLVLRGADAEVLSDDRGVYRISQLPPGTYVVGVLSETTTLPANLAAEVDSVPPNQPAARAVVLALLPSGGRITNGEGLRLGNSVLQQPGPMSVLAPDGRLLSYATTFSPGTATTADATVITLGSGEQQTSVDVPLRLSPTVQVSGVVTSPSGPMQNLAVRLFPPNAADTTDYQPLGAATAITDAAGAFTFLGVTPGQYALRTSFVTVGSAPEVSLWAAQPLTVGDSDITDLAVAMRPGIRVSGRVEVKAQAGSPAVNPQNCQGGLRPLGAQIWRTSRARTGADGTFTTAGDPAGRYSVFASCGQGWTLQAVSRGGRRVADDIIDLDAADIADLVLTLSNKPSRISGSVVDVKGTPDAETNVIVFPAEPTTWRDGVFSDRRVRLIPATSTAAFEISGLAPGDYYAVAINARLISDWQDPAFLDRLIAGATRFTLGESEDKTLALKTFTPRSR